MVVIGPGISGIAGADYLKRIGILFEVIERQAIGGTWLLNSYPHVRVDSPFCAFQYKFIKNYKWGEYFLPGDRIREYLDFFFCHKIRCQGIHKIQPRGHWIKVERDDIEVEFEYSTQGSDGSE